MELVYSSILVDVEKSLRFVKCRCTLISISFVPHRLTFSCFKTDIYEISMRIFSRLVWIIACWSLPTYFIVWILYFVFKWHSERHFSVMFCFISQYINNLGRMVLSICSTRQYQLKRIFLLPLQNFSQNFERQSFWVLFVFCWICLMYRAFQ